MARWRRGERLRALPAVGAAKRRVYLGMDRAKLALREPQVQSLYRLPLNR
jgi:hypothetical protein